jgi:GTP-binding protein EngB required for normal cell division
MSEIENEVSESSTSWQNTFIIDRYRGKTHTKYKSKAEHLNDSSGKWRITLEISYDFYIEKKLLEKVDFITLRIIPYSNSVRIISHFGTGMITEEAIVWTYRDLTERLHAEERVVYEVIPQEKCLAGFSIRPSFHDKDSNGTIGESLYTEHVEIFVSKKRKPLYDNRVCPAESVGIITVGEPNSGKSELLNMMLDQLGISCYPLKTGTAYHTSSLYGFWFNEMTRGYYLNKKIRFMDTRGRSLNAENDTELINRLLEALPEGTKLQEKDWVNKEIDLKNRVTHILLVAAIPSISKQTKISGKWNRQRSQLKKLRDLYKTLNKQREGCVYIILTHCDKVSNELIGKIRKTFSDISESIVWVGRKCKDCKHSVCKHPFSDETKENVRKMLQDIGIEIPEVKNEKIEKQ